MNSIWGKLRTFGNFLIYRNVGRTILSFIWLCTFLIIFKLTCSEWAFWAAMLAVVYLMSMTLIIIVKVLIEPFRKRKSPVKQVIEEHENELKNGK